MTAGPFVDSGAYSAAMQGAEIDIDAYIAFIKRNADVIEVYANLDVISKGERGEDTAALTYRNQQYMEAAGLSPMPVFHAGEDESYLKHYVENYEYIGLGGVAQPGFGLTFTTRAWLDRLFSQYVCDEAGWPRVKVHGFGITAVRDMLRWPWYSVDSASWVLVNCVGGGSIYVPRRRNGRWVYDEGAWIVPVSVRRNSKVRRAAVNAKQHFTTMSPRSQALVLDYLGALGYPMGHSDFRYVDPEYSPEVDKGERWADARGGCEQGRRRLEIVGELGVCNDHGIRDRVNITYFQRLQEEMGEWPRRFEPHGAAPSLAL